MCDQRPSSVIQQRRSPRSAYVMSGETSREGALKRVSRWRDMLDNVTVGGSCILQFSEIMSHLPVERHGRWEKRDGRALAHSLPDVGHTRCGAPTQRCGPGHG